MNEIFELLHANSAQPAAERIVLSLIYQLIAILAATHLTVSLARRFLGQTDVSGEILAGLLLGPSCLGIFFPGAMAALFPPSSAPILTVLAQLGLIFLMFEVGLSFEFGIVLHDGRAAVASVAFLGLAVPFALGFFTAPWFLARIPGPHPPQLGFQLFFATAMSITAIPILGRIFLELRLAHTRLATIVLTAAALEDVAGWIILGVVGAVVQSRFSPLALGLRIALVVLYLAILFAVVRPALQHALASSRKSSTVLTPSITALVILAVLASAAVTSHIGIFAIIGGFALGVALHDDRLFVADWTARMSPMVRAILLPIFFTYTGLRTDIGSLPGPAMWILCALVILTAFAGKFGGSYLGARWAGESARDAVTIGVCMNTRALMELIALNTGYDLGVLPKSMFTMLVIMAIASTFITTPAVRRLMRRHALPAAGPSTR
ncbi:MAG: cation:proton antiporter [Bryobacteraceae bacterium]